MLSLYKPHKVQVLVYLFYCSRIFLVSFGAKDTSGYITDTNMLLRFPVPLSILPSSALVKRLAGKNISKMSRVPECKTLTHWVNQYLALWLL